MPLSRYKNIEDLNSRITNEAQFLDKEDIFIISQNEKEESKFGECDTDILEFSVYDINNNIITLNDNSTAKYFKGPEQINNYLIKTDTNEFAVNVEELLKQSGFSNGIFKVNLKFLRQRVGDDTKYRKAYIQEISATRQEIRILPLVVQSSIETTSKNKDEIVKMQKLDVDYNTYASHINSVLSVSGESILSKAKDYIEKKFEAAGGVNIFDRILREDFLIAGGVNSIINSIYSEIRTNVLEELSTKSQIGEVDESSINCGVVPSELYDRVMISILETAIKEKGFGVRESVIQRDTNIATETTAENIFETKRNINTQIIRENVPEYTTVNLSDIQLSSSNVDDFDVLNTQLLALLTPVQPISDTPIDNPISDTPSTPTLTAIDLYQYTDKTIACTGDAGRLVSVYMDSLIWDTANYLYLNTDLTSQIKPTTIRYYSPVDGGNLKSLLLGNTLSVVSCTI